MEKIKELVLELAHSLSTEIGVVFADGSCTSTSESRVCADLERGADLALVTNGPIQHGDYIFMKINLEDNDRVVVYVAGTLAGQEDLLQVLAKYITDQYESEASAAERNAFLKNVLLENELPGDIPLKARDYGIDYFLSRQIFVLRFTEKVDDSCLAQIQTVLTDDNDYFLNADEHNVIAMLSLENRTEGDIERAANELIERFKENVRQVYIGIGMEAEHLKDCAASYRQADLALTVGSIFEEEEHVMWYNRLGLGRLIYQLPPTLCEMFLSEVFEPDAYEALDPETLLTIDKFFENNLNGSETSRQLFVHRNTLVYRLDKVEKITGLDLRTFDDAVLFKLASMVRKYLEFLQQKSEAHTIAKHW